MIGEFNQKEIDMFINQRKNLENAPPNGPEEEAPGPSDVSE